MVEDYCTILVIDDDEPMLTMAALLLEAEGYRVLTAANGQKGLEAVERTMPDLIVLDLRMPVMSGWEFASQFKARYGDRVPILVLTAAHDAAGNAEKIGAVASLEKPFDLECLVKLVGECIGCAVPGSEPAPRG